MRWLFRAKPLVFRMSITSSGFVMYLAASCCMALEAPVYESIGVDGSPRYATQQLDSSYVLVSGETSRRKAFAQVTSSPYNLVDAIARHHGVAPALVHAIIEVESNRNPRAVSARGAVGMMQLMPRTGAHYGVSHAALFDAKANIETGVRHLKSLLEAHQGNVALALAAYNSGSGAVKRYGHRIPPYRETMLYVPAVLAKSARREKE